ncbi:glycoside hydrolase family 95 protein [Ruminococcaceae bacterium OttesenSCG-928-L11]|nr:glycoside hydrolase family 95 protein [Ruminococcaceae bacterium OttesenSCG-928-L11]
MPDNRHTLRMETPASWWPDRWREAIPAGNGETGIMVYGGVHRETVLINHSDLWSGAQTDPLPDVSEAFHRMREMVLAQDSREGSDHLLNALKEADYAPRLAKPLPLADLVIAQPVTEGFTQYNRSLDMATGEIAVEWRDSGILFTRQFFVSRHSGMIVVRLACGEGGALSGSATLRIHEGFLSPHFRQPEVPSLTELRCQGDCLYYSGKSPDGVPFGAVMRAVSGCECAENGEIVFAGQEALLLVQAFAGNPEDGFDLARRELAAVEDSYDVLLSRHSALHGAFYHSARLDLGAEEHAHALSCERLLLEAYRGESPLALLEKQWRFSRYLLTSAVRPGGKPCHLYGLWCGEYNAMWAFSMFNVNSQMMYWPCLAGNMATLHLSLFDYIDSMMEDYRQNARRLFGCGGIYIPSVSTPESGLMKLMSHHILNWTGAAGWIAQHYYDYYLYTGDVAFLRQRALPFMVETAQFYEDFLVEGEDGLLMVVPSISPENVPGNFVDSESLRYVQTAINSTMDFAIVRELLTNLLAGAAMTGLYAEKLPWWQEMLTRIPPYRINADGAAAEWMHPRYSDNYAHRHQSHTYPLFPGTEITAESDPELYRAFCRAIELRQDIGVTSQTGWSKVYMACNYARMRRGNDALRCLDMLARSELLPNFLTLHNDHRDMGLSMGGPWAPVQVDACIGFSAALLEMLVYSRYREQCEIRLLPALPQRLEWGQISGVRCRGFVTVDVEWDRVAGQCTATLVSDVNQEVRVFCREQETSLRLAAGQAESLRFPLEEH